MKVEQTFSSFESADVFQVTQELSFFLPGFTSGVGGFTQWDDVQNKPTEFTPSTHSHEISEVTGLTDALDGKQTSLGFTAENIANKGVAGGYAELDVGGKVPAAQLPSYVDDVVPVANFAALPGTGETGKIYVTEDDGKIFRWSGSSYVEISPSPGSTDAVPEGSTNKYFTETRVRGSVLTGYTLGSRTALLAADTFISAFGKIGKYLADLGDAAFASASAAGLSMLTAVNAAAQTALLDAFVASGASHKKGLVPTPGSTAGTKRYLCEDATWSTPIEHLSFAASDESTALTSGASKVTLRMPYAFTLTEVRASLKTAQTSGSIFTVDINESGTSVLSTKLTIDNTEKTSTTAATAAVISDSALADDAEITVDIDQIGDGTAKGLKIILIGRRA